MLMNLIDKNFRFKIFLILILTTLLTCIILTGCNKPSENNNLTETSNSTEQVSNSSATVIGGNNLISVDIEKADGETYEIYCLLNGEYQKVDQNLISDSEMYIKAEILGLKSGSYSVRIDVTKDGKVTENYINDIKVSDIDRSGYAHFNKTEGIGAYNLDGTLKQNATVLYLTNENKNTLTATFSGKTYTGIVNILTNLRYAQNPVVIRVIGRIETNQWKSKNLPSRLTDNSNFDETFFENTFETTIKENVIGLNNNITDAKDGKKYHYITTKDGIKLDRTTTDGEKKTLIYNRSEFPEIKGKEVYADDSNFNTVTVKNAKNITIEGAFEDAGLYQWGIIFRDCNSIEIKNLTFDSYTEDAISFYTTANGTQKVYPYKDFFCNALRIFIWKK